MGVQYKTLIPQVIRNAENYADAAVRKAAFDILGDAQERAPVDSGNLVGSGFVEIHGERHAEVAFSAEYAAYVELGTSNPNYPVQPFLRPAFDRVAPSLIQELRSVMRP